MIIVPPVAAGTPIDLDAVDAQAPELARDLVSRLAGGELSSLTSSRLLDVELNLSRFRMAIDTIAAEAQRQVGAAINAANRSY